MSNTPPPAVDAPAYSPPNAPKVTPQQTSGNLAMSSGQKNNMGTVCILYAQEGWGKSTFLAGAPKGGLVYAANEDGIDMLVQSGQVNDIPRVAVSTWDDLILASRQNFIGGDYKFALFDTLDGFEQLCQQSVCDTHFNGDMGSAGFLSYGKGYKLTATKWKEFTDLIRDIRRSGTNVILTNHTKVSTFQDPMGDDYSRYSSNLHQDIWNATKYVADFVLFGDFLTVIRQTGNKDKQKVHETSGTQRVLHTKRCDAFDAKRRGSMPDIIKIPEDPAQVFSTIWTPIHKALKGKSNG